MFYFSLTGGRRRVNRSLFSYTYYTRPITRHRKLFQGVENCEMGIPIDRNLRPFFNKGGKDGSAIFHPAPLIPYACYDRSLVRIIVIRGSIVYTLPMKKWHLFWNNYSIKSMENGKLNPPSETSSSVLVHTRPPNNNMISFGRDFYVRVYHCSVYHQIGVSFGRNCFVLLLSIISFG